MKFMKLGSRPDTFYTTGDLRSVSTEVSTDIIIVVKGVRYLLHKFPLLSKCLHLQRLCSECSDSSKPSQELVIQLLDFPSGIEAFEICAKFCYGITITLSALNIVSVRCAAEYLQMKEDVDKGNLISKLEAFLNSCILRGWKDSLLTLQTTKSFPLWSEDLGITSRCIDAIASGVLSFPAKPNLSYGFSKVGRDDSSCNGTASQRLGIASQGWWAEDIAEFGIDLYWRTIVAIKAGGKVPANLIGKALQIYVTRWLPNISKEGIINTQDDSESIGEITAKYRFLLESIVSLLPMEKGSVSCSFLLKLLKAGNILGASFSSKMELARRVGIQLEEAKLSDLLIPSLSTNGTHYDVDIVMTILEQFMLQTQSPPTSPPRAKARYQRRRSRSAENFDFEFQESRRSSSASHSSKLKVAKLVDGYLREIARDPNLPLLKVIALAESIPDFARPDHDDLYRAIDIYLKSHKNLNKSERKQLCRILDCKKLSAGTCMHAAQNELLPLRMVVQVLFIEQSRASMAGGIVTELPNNIKLLLGTHEDDSLRPLPPGSTAITRPTEEEWSMSGPNSPNSKLSTLRMKLTEDEDQIEDGVGRNSKLKSTRSIPAGPKKMLSRLLSLNRTVS
ncbi:NPH3 domain [Macleaya cordata]|uniref:NPH3 domain n=1 Tax=Macleaya cordata TaxID=56857 RepID=A0A200RDP0_MACCD|nr:NPH3 domain [Macleaya cordata]